MDPGERLTDRLASLYAGASRRTLKQWLAAGRVQVNGRMVRRGDAAVAPGDQVRLVARTTTPFPSLVRLVHEDADVIVVDKPPGLLTIATERERERTAYRALADYVGAARDRPRLFVVHRLDRDTSGLLVFAKTAAAKRCLQDQFAARTVERVYVAVVEGQVRAEGGELRARLAEDRALRVRLVRDSHAGREAITRYRVLARRAASTVLELTLVTGRRGQLRAQLAALGHPIVGDAAYGSSQNPVQRLCLHATRLGFVHPQGPTVRYESRPPSAFRSA